MIKLRSPWTVRLLAGAVPVGVAAAWIPLRDRLPNTDLALILVVVIAAVGLSGGAPAALVSAVCASVAFDLLDTRPYGTLAMSRGVDVTTALILLGTGVLVGAGAARLGRYRRSEDSRSDALAVVMEASGLVATGEERELITEALAEELRRSLRLIDCEFEARPPSGRSPMVARNGGLVGLLDATGGAGPSRIDLPIWCQGEIVAHYRLTFRGKAPSQEDLRVALSLADQAGAAMSRAGGGPPGSGPGGAGSRRGRLKAVGAADAAALGDDGDAPRGRLSAVGRR